MNTHHEILVKKLKVHSQALALRLGRKVGQPGHDVARDYLLQRMWRTLLHRTCSPQPAGNQDL